MIDLLGTLGQHLCDEADRVDDEYQDAGQRPEADRLDEDDGNDHEQSCVVSAAVPAGRRLAECASPA